MVRSPALFEKGDALSISLRLEHPSPPNISSSSSFTIPFVTCERAPVVHPFGSGIFGGESPLDFSFPLFIFEICFIVFLIHLLHFLFRPLKQPRIVAEIIAGIIVGPSFLGKSHKYMAIMFPPTALYVLRNFAVLGFCYFVFITGVKMDASVIKTSARKDMVITIVGVTVPTITTTIAIFSMRDKLEDGVAKYTSIGAICSSLAITSFPSLYPVLKEMKLLSSEIGRRALASAIISDAMGVMAFAAFEASLLGEVNGAQSLWYIASTLVLVCLILGGCRKLMRWIINQTPEGKPVQQIYITCILAGVMGIAFISDMLGIAIANGPILLGLVIPDGPPLGAAIVERCESFVWDVIMPLSFTAVGLTVDVFSIGSGWSYLYPLLITFLVGYITKIAAYLVTSLLYKTPLRHSLAYSLILSVRGQMELLLFLHWMDKRMILIPEFSLFVLLTLSITMVASPFISILYNPAKPYRVNKRRTIQHTAPDSELRILACIHDAESVPGIIHLLEASNPTLFSPFSVYALRLIDLVGRASPVFIDHQNQDHSFEHTSDNSIHNALQLYQETREEDVVKIQSFTAVAPRSTMYQDICEMAVHNKITLIVLPFHKERAGYADGTEWVRSGVKSVNTSVVANAPCSVAILVDKGVLFSRPNSVASFRSGKKMAVLFLGGADAREALAYADRMAGNGEVSMAVVRFLAGGHEGEDEKEKKVDDGAVKAFWVRNESNERVSFREVVVRNGAETVEVIQGMNDGEYDLWVMGRKQGINPVLLQGLDHWSENHELGAIGDFVASEDFGCMGSVLVVQQHCWVRPPLRLVVGEPAELL